jgi:hypothetical protein
MSLIWLIRELQISRDTLSAKAKKDIFIPLSIIKIRRLFTQKLWN